MKSSIQLHVKLEEPYNDFFTRIDDVAERIVTLAGTPNHNYSEYLKISDVKESGVVEVGYEAVHDLPYSFKRMFG